MKLTLLVAVLAMATQGVATPVSSVQETNDAFIKQWRARIAGHENDPAERVFKNIQKMTSIPAGTFLVIMNRGYSRGLGVTCTHCHDENDFASDDKRPKRAAREMMDIHRAVNDRLKELTNLQTPTADRAINCSTCHRGSVNPVASDMKQREAPQRAMCNVRRADVRRANVRRTTCGRARHAQATNAFSLLTRQHVGTCARRTSARRT